MRTRLVGFIFDSKKWVHAGACCGKLIVLPSKYILFTDVVDSNPSLRATATGIFHTIHPSARP